MYAEKYNVYGVSGLGLGLSLTLFIFIYAWSGVFSGGAVDSAVSFFSFIFISALVASLALRTIQVGYAGTERGIVLLYGLAGSFAISMIVGVVFGSVVYMTVLSALMAAIAEEVFARGFIYPFFTRLTANKAVGAMFSVGLWMLLHTVAYGGNISAYIFIFFNGLLMTWCMEKAQSLDVPILIHLLNNLAVSMLLLGVV